MSNSRAENQGPTMKQRKYRSCQKDLKGRLRRIHKSPQEEKPSKIWRPRKHIAILQQCSQELLGSFSLLCPTLQLQEDQERQLARERGRKEVSLTPFYSTFLSCHFWVSRQPACSQPLLERGKFLPLDEDPSVDYYTN